MRPSFFEMKHIMATRHPPYTASRTPTPLRDKSEARHPPNTASSTPTPIQDKGEAHQQAPLPRMEMEPATSANNSEKVIACPACVHANFFVWSQDLASINGE